MATTAPTTPKPSPWRWTIWGVYLFAWTAALIMPVPGGDGWEIEALRINLKLLLGKGLHVLAYAALAMLTGRLAVRVRYRLLLMYFLMAHTVLTEILQMTVSYRSGTLWDALLDQVGIALGVLLSWPWWTAPDAAEESVATTPAERAYAGAPRP
jgi:hypothetical protein